MIIVKLENKKRKNNFNYTSEKMFDELNGITVFMIMIMILNLKQ